MTEPLLVGLFQRRRVNPRASDGGAWEDTPPRFQAVPAVSFNAIYGLVGTVL